MPAYETKMIARSQQRRARDPLVSACVILEHRLDCCCIRWVDAIAATAHKVESGAAAPLGESLLGNMCPRCTHRRRRLEVTQWAEGKNKPEKVLIQDHT